MLGGSGRDLRRTVNLSEHGLFDTPYYIKFLRQFQEKLVKNMKINGNLAVDLSAAEQQLLFQHNPQTTSGWITLAKKDPTTKRFRQYHYQPEELALVLSEWMGEDVYYSQNTFYKPKRRIDTIRQLRSLYVDLDVYNLGLTPEWVLGKLEFETFGQGLPEPNMVIFSGRGLVLVWNIEPIPYHAMPLWRAVETYFVDQLKEVGADAKASDPARIFRLAGTINSKSNAMVQTEYRHDYRYDIHQIQDDYLPELSPKKLAVKKKGRHTKIVRMFNTYTLHLSRARDIARLVELRHGDVEGFRETILFLYRYWTCCFTDDPDKALEDTLSLNNEFIHPLPEKEVRSATKSAEKAWSAKSDAKANELAKALGYPGAGYNIPNAKIIEWLDITPEEQQHLSSIIGAVEKRRRNRLQKEKWRRSQGMRPMEEYNQDRKQQVLSKADQLKRLILENPRWTNAQLAEAMNTTVRSVQRWKKH